MYFQGDLTAFREENDGRGEGWGGETKERCLCLYHISGELFCLNPLVLFYSRDRLRATPLGTADVPGFLPQGSAIGTIINYL